VPAKSPERRSLISSIGAHSLHSQGKTNTQPARDEFMARFEREVDPDGLLYPAERARRAEHARKAYFARLALASVKARAKKAAKT
jgi:hypothetical protein